MGNQVSSEEDTHWVPPPSEPVDSVRDTTPKVLLLGDVGCGKSELSNSLHSAIQKQYTISMVKTRPENYGVGEGAHTTYYRGVGFGGMKIFDTPGFSWHDDMFSLSDREMLLKKLLRGVKPAKCPGECDWGEDGTLRTPREICDMLEDDPSYAIDFVFWVIDGKKQVRWEAGPEIEMPRSWLFFGGGKRKTREYENKLDDVYKTLFRTVENTIRTNFRPYVIFTKMDLHGEFWDSAEKALKDKFIEEGISSRDEIFAIQNYTEKHRINGDVIAKTDEVARYLYRSTTLRLEGFLNAL